MIRFYFLAAAADVVVGGDDLAAAVAVVAVGAGEDGATPAFLASAARIGSSAPAHKTNQPKPTKHDMTISQITLQTD